MSNVFKGVMTVAVLFVAAIAAVGIVATAPQPERVEPEAVATAIRTTLISKADVRLIVRSQGTVTPRVESTVIPEVSGRIRWISPNLVPGGYFNFNDILVKIDDQDANSTVERNKASLSRSKAEAEHSAFELRRLEQLVKNKLTSQSTLESAIRAKRVSDAVLKESEIALKQALRDLLRTEVRAPYSGLVRSKSVDVGQFVSRGSPIAQIYSSDAVEVRIPLADSQLAYLDLPLGQRGELPEALRSNVTLSTHYGGQYYEWQGKLVRTEAEIDTRTRMVYAVVRVMEDPESTNPPLPVGLFVHASIEGRIAKDVVVLPRAVLRNQSQVLVVDENNRLRYRDVELLRFDRDEVIISSGLRNGEIVNLSPLQTVIDGMRVKLVQEPSDS